MRIGLTQAQDVSIICIILDLDIIKNIMLYSWTIIIIALELVRIYEFVILYKKLYTNWLGLS